MMNIDITKATRRDTPMLRQLYEFYCYDFSEFMSSDVTDTGMYTDDKFLTGYWPEPAWSSYIVRVDGRLAGFAWVLKTTLFPDDEQPDNVAMRRALAEANLLASEHTLIEEFFIMRGHRHKGVGEYVANWLFDRYPGVWEVSEIVANTPAQAFWRRIIDRYTRGGYIEVNVNSQNWQGPVQVFRSNTR